MTDARTLSPARLGLAEHRGGQVDVRDLAAGVHPRVGAPRDGELRRGVQAQHPAERRLDLPLHGAPVRLPGPPGELRAVVGDVQPQPHHGRRRSLRDLPGGRGPVRPRTGGLARRSGRPKCCKRLCHGTHAL